jgi:hypothetical protein
MKTNMMAAVAAVNHCGFVLSCQCAARCRTVLCASSASQHQVGGDVRPVTSSDRERVVDGRAVS